MYSFNNLWDVPAHLYLTNGTFNTEYIPKAHVYAVANKNLLIDATAGTPATCDGVECVTGDIALTNTESYILNTLGIWTRFSTTVDTAANILRYTVVSDTLIPKGTCVRWIGVANNKIKVAPISSDTQVCIGITNEDINLEGYIVAAGFLEGVTTNDATIAAGDILYFTTTGALTKTIPTGVIQAVAYCLKRASNVLTLQVLVAHPLQKADSLPIDFTIGTTTYSYLSDFLPDVVTLAATQTLTNKTITDPVIKKGTYTVSIPALAASDTLVTLAATQTLTNKTITDPVIKKGTYTVSIPALAAPDTLVTLAATQTLTNKTITDPTISYAGTSYSSFVSAINVSAPLSYTPTNPSIPTLTISQATALTDGYLTKELFDQLSDTLVLRVRCASTANITLGVALTTLDGVTLDVGNKILLKNQTTTTQNGIYKLDASKIPQRIQANIDYSGAVVHVRQGTTNAKSTYICTSDPAIHGVNALVFELSRSDFNTSSGTSNITPGTGISSAFDAGTFTYTISLDTDYAATLTTTQTLTNKTLTTPTIAAIKSGSFNITVPTVTAATSFAVLNLAQTYTATPTFSTGFSSTVANGTTPFTVTSTTKVANLNADTVDGFDTYTSYSTVSNKLLPANITSPSNGQLLTFDGTNWINKTLTFPSSITLGTGNNLIEIGATTSNDVDVDATGNLDLAAEKSMRFIVSKDADATTTAGRSFVWYRDDSATATPVLTTLMRLNATSDTPALVLTTTDAGLYLGDKNVGQTRTYLKHIGNTGTLSLSKNSVSTQVTTAASVNRTITLPDYSGTLVTDNNAHTISAVWTYSAIPAFNGGTSGTSAPFTVDSTFKVTNLNADLLDGYHAATSGTDVLLPVTISSPSSGQVLQYNGSTWSNATLDTLVLGTSTNYIELGATSTADVDIDANRNLDLAAEKSMRFIISKNASATTTDNLAFAWYRDDSATSTMSNTVLMRLNGSTVNPGLVLPQDITGIYLGNTAISACHTYLKTTATVGTLGLQTSDITSVHLIGTAGSTHNLTLPAVTGTLATIDNAHTISAAWTYTAIPAFNGGTSGTSAPFTVDSTFNVTNLNADLLDGYHVGTSGAAVPLLNGDNTWSGLNIFGSNTQVSGASAGTMLTVSNSSTGHALNVSAGSVNFQQALFTTNSGVVLKCGAVDRLTTTTDGVIINGQATFSDIYFTGNVLADNKIPLFVNVEDPDAVTHMARMETGTFIKNTGIAMRDGYRVNNGAIELVADNMVTNSLILSSISRLAITGEHFTYWNATFGIQKFAPLFIFDTSEAPTDTWDVSAAIGTVTLQYQGRVLTIDFNLVVNMTAVGAFTIRLVQNSSMTGGTLSGRLGWIPITPKSSYPAGTNLILFGVLNTSDVGISEVSHVSSITSQGSNGSVNSQFLRAVSKGVTPLTVIGGTHAEVYALDDPALWRCDAASSIPITFASDGNWATGALQTAIGSPTAPAYSFSSDSNTGMYRFAEDNLSFATAGVEKLRISGSSVIIPSNNGSTGDAALELGYSRTGDGYAYIDFSSSTTPDYDLRLIRDPGPNGGASFAQKGTGGFYIKTLNAAPLQLATSNIGRLTLDGTNGNATLVSTSTSAYGLSVTNPSSGLYVNYGNSTATANWGFQLANGSSFIGMGTNFTAGAYNPIVGAGDKSIIFGDGASNTGVLNIAPWSDVAFGIKLDRPSMIITSLGELKVSNEGTPSAGTTLVDSYALSFMGGYWDGSAARWRSWAIKNDMTATTPSSNLTFIWNGSTKASLTSDGYLYVNGNIVWHAGNDGAGSGLDADLLDGYPTSLTGSASSIPVVDANSLLYLPYRVIVGNTSGSVALTINDGYGNANLAFNHSAGIPDVTGSSARIVASVDSATGSMDFQVKNSTTSGTAVTLTSIMTLYETSANIYKPFYPSANIYAPLGSGGAPSYTFNGDSDTGISAAIANQLDLSAGGATRLSITSSRVDAQVDLGMTNANPLLELTNSSSAPSANSNACIVQAKNDRTSGDVMVVQALTKAGLTLGRLSIKADKSLAYTVGDGASAWTADKLTITSTGAVTGTSFNSITGLASVAPLANGTATVGTSTLVARQDHVHPTQTTAAAWTTARTLTIGLTGKTVDGSANVSWTLADIGAAASSHGHGSITSAGAIGSTSGVPIITTTGGVLAAGSFGSLGGTFCQGNDPRLSDNRTPTAHTHSAADITLGTLGTARGGTGLGTFTSGGAVYATSTSVLTTGTLPITAGGTGGTDAATARTNLGLGTAATYATGTSGAVVPLLDASNTWSASQTINSASTTVAPRVTFISGRSTGNTAVIEATGSGGATCSLTFPYQVSTSGAITIDLPNASGTVALTSHTHTLSALTDTSISANTAGEILKWSGAAWINNTLAEAGIAAASHSHGSITSAGAIGSTSGVPIITTTGGVLAAGSFGTAAGTFCQGNDSRLSDSRTPTAHVHSATDITSGTLGTARGGTGLGTFTLGGAMYATSTSVLTTGTLPITAGGTGATDSATARTNLGLGSAATYATGTSGGTVPLLNGSNTWSAQQTIAGIMPNTDSTNNCGNATTRWSAIHSLSYVAHTTCRPYGNAGTETLGTSGNRWGQIYSTISTISTSDARLKTELSSLTPEEVLAASAISKNIGIYKFLDAIAIKGDSARKHSGVIAQQVYTILEAYGLSPFDYGFLCYDKWDDAFDDYGYQTTVAGDLYSLRYEELLMFLMAAQEQRISQLEARLLSLP